MQGWPAHMPGWHTLAGLQYAGVPWRWLKQLYVCTPCADISMDAKLAAMHARLAIACCCVVRQWVQYAGVPWDGRGGCRIATLAAAFC
jgi:hypothetical protein